MSTIRNAVVLALTLAAVGGGTAATAAPRRLVPVCNLVVDARNDEYASKDATLDVVSADVVSNRDRITGVIRLAGAADGMSQTSPTGHAYHIDFGGQGGANTVFLEVMVTPNAVSASYGHFDAQSQLNHIDGAATAKVAGNVVALTAPLSVLAPYGRFTFGSRIDRLGATSTRQVGAFVDRMKYGFVPSLADTATSRRTYIAGTRSCVRVGG